MDSFGNTHHPAEAGRHLYPVGRDDVWLGDWLDEPSYARTVRPRQLDLMADLVTLVGGADVLAELDCEPIPDEPFDWSVVEERDRSFVAEVLALSDQCCNELLDTQFRTIARRLLARVAERDPGPLRRNTKANRCAAGLVWLAGQASAEFGRRGRRTTACLWTWFGVTSCADRGRSLRAAAGLEPWIDPASWATEPLALGDAAFLHSEFRQLVIRQRDAVTKLTTPPRKWTTMEDGRSVRFAAEPVKVVLTAKGHVQGASRLMVLLALGDDLEDASYFALSVPDAHQLVSRLQSALDDPAPHAAHL